MSNPLFWGAQAPLKRIPARHGNNFFNTQKRQNHRQNVLKLISTIKRQNAGLLGGYFEN